MGSSRVQITLQSLLPWIKVTRCLCSQISQSLAIGYRGESVKFPQWSSFGAQGQSSESRQCKLLVAKCTQWGGGLPSWWNRSWRIQEGFWWSPLKTPSLVYRQLSKGSNSTRNQWNELASHNVFRTVLEEKGESTLRWMQSWLNKHFRRTWNEWLLFGGIAPGADPRTPSGAWVAKHLCLHLGGWWRAHPSKSVDYPKLRGKVIEQREKKLERRFQWMDSYKIEIKKINVNVMWS